MLKDKKIVLGISGGIAAYKAAYLVRALRKKGAEVQVIITPNGKEFITPLTLSTLSNNPVISEFFTANSGEWNSHVDLGLWADAMIIAPATASTLGKMANGVADNILVTAYLSMKAPVFIAPAMDLDMYKHPSTQKNLAFLKSCGNFIIEPAEGWLASGLEGKGRMEEPDRIVKHLENYFAQKEIFKGKKILVTAGPTYEKLDPVRFIGNFSSGKMGFALAEVFALRGAEVTLIAGPVNLEINSPRIKRIDVESADEMLKAAEANFKSADAAIFCAAVADYKPRSPAPQKIKREKNAELNIALVRNPDIAAALGKIKKKGQITAGFALESVGGIENAKRKLKEKNLDFIVLNSLKDKGCCFGSDNNKITIITQKTRTEYPVKPKREAAADIAGELEKYL